MVNIPVAMWSHLPTRETRQSGLFIEHIVTTSKIRILLLRKKGKLDFGKYLIRS